MYRLIGKPRMKLNQIQSPTLEGIMMWIWMISRMTSRRFLLLCVLLSYTINDNVVYCSTYSVYCGFSVSTPLKIAIRKGQGYHSSMFWSAMTLLSTVCALCTRDKHSRTCNGYGLMIASLCTISVYFCLSINVFKASALPSSIIAMLSLYS